MTKNDIIQHEQFYFKVLIIEDFHIKYIEVKKRKKKEKKDDHH